MVVVFKPLFPLFAASVWSEQDIYLYFKFGQFEMNININTPILQIRGDTFLIHRLKKYFARVLVSFTLNVILV